ncbi:MAG: diguanylate cyclase [Sideroxydans sp.]|nr:diguanylate cyclase [Sideroxydans sp.]
MNQLIRQCWAGKAANMREQLAVFLRLFQRILWLLFALYVLPCKALDSPPLAHYRVAIDREYAPYEFLDASGTAQGYTPNLLRAIGTAAHVEFEFIALDWPDALAALEAGKVDIINMIRTPERAARYQFSTPHSRIAQAIFRHHEQSKIVDLDSLAGHAVGLQKNDISAVLLAHRSDFKAHFVDSKIDGLMHLNLGKTDAFLCAEQSCVRAIAEYNFLNIDLAEGNLFAQDFAFATHRNNPVLLALLNQQLSQLETSGRMNALKVQWLQGSVHRASWLENNLLAVLVVTAVALVLLWNVLLRKLVRVRTKRLQQHLVFADALNKIAHSVMTRVDAESIFDEVIQVLSATLQTDRALIYDISYRHHHAQALCECLNPAHPEISATKATYSLDLFIAAADEIRRTRQPLSSQYDAINAHLLDTEAGAILHRDMQIRSLLWYPFAFREDGFYMFALNQIYADKSYSQVELDFLASVSQMVSIALEKIRLLAESQHLSFYDALTQLPNRRLLLDRLQQALLASARSEKAGAVLFIDLDYFKTINDTLGHLAGDSLLQQVAQRLSGCVREGDTVARLGGDEFIVMLENLSRLNTEAIEQTRVIGMKILAALAEPYDLAGQHFKTTSSIGATVFMGAQHSTEELIKQSDIAMYQAKQVGRNGLQFYAASLTPAH